MNLWRNFIEAEWRDVGGGLIGATVAGREIGWWRDYARAALKRAATKAERNRRTIGKLLRKLGKLAPLDRTDVSHNPQAPVHLIPRNIGSPPCRVYSPPPRVTPLSPGAEIFVSYHPFLVYPSPGGSQLAADLPTRSRLAQFQIRTALGIRGAWYSPM